MPVQRKPDGSRRQQRPYRRESETDLGDFVLHYQIGRQVLENVLKLARALRRVVGRIGFGRDQFQCVLVNASAEPARPTTRTAPKSTPAKPLLLISVGFS